MTAQKDKTQLTEDDIYEEHQRSVKPTAHWAYLFGVLGGGLLFMIALIALLGGST
jgi:lipid-A-disaccharide synthase-like uncharacterized protein